MHIWRIHIDYRGSLGWVRARVDVIATSGMEAMETLERRWGKDGVRVKEFLQLGDRPRILFDD